MKKAPEDAHSGHTERIDAPGLGPLPDAELAEVFNRRTGERELSTHGVAYYGSNWEILRWLYTADQMRAYAAQERAAVAADFAEADALREKMGDILRRTAIALRGPEPPLTSWSWHDLPERAAGAAAAVPAGHIVVPRWLLERASESLGSFVSDHGWAQIDMDAMDDIDSYLARSPTPPAEPIPETIGVQFVQLIAEIWRQKPNAGIREVLDELNAQFGRPAEPVARCHWDECPHGSECVHAAPPQAAEPAPAKDAPAHTESM